MLSNAAATSLPVTSLCLSLQGPAGIVVDAAGNPVGSALPLETLGATPRALAASGAFLLVVSEGGIHVFDREGGSEVQRLGFGPLLRPLPGQPLYAATADGTAAGPAAASGAAAGWDGSGGVAVAGRRLVWLCLPVSAADQTRELLSQRDYKAALELIEGGLRQGAPWAQVAAAQAALLLLHGGSLRMLGLCVCGHVGACVHPALHCCPEVAVCGVVCILPLHVHDRAHLCCPQSAGSRRRWSAWSGAAPPHSSPPSSSRSSPPTPPPGRSRCACSPLSLIQCGGWMACLLSCNV